MFRQHKTDDEYVESQRKWISIGKWFAMAGVILIVGLVASAWSVLGRLFDMAASYDESYQYGLVLGIVSTQLFFGLAMCVGAVLRLVYPPRIVRLLVAYHDRLQALEKPSASAGALPKID